MSDQCPLCGHAITAESKPVQYDDDNIPYAIAMRPGFGVPWSKSANYRVMLDGKELYGAVAYDRVAGVVWRYVHDADGHLVVEHDQIKVEQLHGVVTVRRP